jgi:hypothetical protein
MDHCPLILVSPSSFTSSRTYDAPVGSPTRSRWSTSVSVWVTHDDLGSLCRNVDETGERLQQFWVKARFRPLSTNRAGGRGESIAPIGNR